MFLHYLWIVAIGFVAGLLARLISPAPNNPEGFILTAILGIAGALVAAYLGPLLHFYSEGQNAGLIGAAIGAVAVLFVWHVVSGRGFDAY
jgi:uncharacterized membrane protein YeaQ/YmgE (transglycosylase-associated protein family)